MIFPQKHYDRPGLYLDDYAREITSAMASVSRDRFHETARRLHDAVHAGRTIFTCGNGGSAAIANHLVCDCVKGVRADTRIRPKVHSLSSNIEIITAIANDIAYEEVFAFQLASFAQAGDVLIAITSSGRSPNIVNAIRHARAAGLVTIAMTGFDGGDALKQTEVSLHVTAENYGVIEDVQQSLMHALAQYLRLSNMHDRSLLGARKF